MCVCVSPSLRERIQIARQGPDNGTVYWICFSEEMDRERKSKREREREKNKEGDWMKKK